MTNCRICPKPVSTTWNAVYIMQPGGPGRSLSWTSDLCWEPATSSPSLFWTGDLWGRRRHELSTQVTNWTQLKLMDHDSWTYLGCPPGSQRLMVPDSFSKVSACQSLISLIWRFEVPLVFSETNHYSFNVSIWLFCILIMDHGYIAKVLLLISYRLMIPDYNKTKVFTANLLNFHFHCLGHYNVW